MTYNSLDREGNVGIVVARPEEIEEEEKGQRIG